MVCIPTFLNGDDVIDFCAMEDLIFANRLFCFKKPRSGRNTDCFQRGRDRKADRLIRPTLVCNQQPCFQRIEPAIDAFHGSVVAFQVDAEIDPAQSALLLAIFFKILKHLFDLDLII